MLKIVFTALLVIIIVSILVKGLKRAPKPVYFVGPHGSGKTVSILSLQSLPNKTVTTTINHKIFYKNREIYELVPDDSAQDFFRKFHINPDGNYVFFVKNEEELDSFPDCSPYNITFVIWKKVETKSRKDLIYLDESPEQLKKVI